MRAVAACVALLIALTAPVRPVRAASEVTLLDLIETEIGYTTIVDRYEERVSAQTLLDGARAALNAELRARGIAHPDVAAMHARADGRGAVPAIEQQIGLAIVRHGARVDVRALVYAAIRGELAALHDPYSVFFTKRELGAFAGALDGTAFGGIGIEIAGDADGTWHVSDVFAGAPAAAAGVRPGDAIVAIDGTPVAGLATARIGALLRGAIGSTVALSLARDGAPPAAPLSIVRAAIVPPDVRARMLDARTGYLALRVFGPRAGSEVHTALLDLQARGARAIVFDLRGNGGGYESAAAAVASAFVRSGVVVITRERHGATHLTRADGTAPPARPLAVLVDGDSASGSELVTGAIAAYGLGTVIGTRTFGKGVVQSIVPLPDGAALKLTTARYFTPDGRSIDRVGITPNVVVAQPPGSVAGDPARDPQLARALALLEPAP